MHMKYASRITFQDNADFSQRTVQERPTFFKRLSEIVIAARCTDLLLWYFSSFLGFIVSALQSIAIATNGWVYITEPHSYNKTNENGDLMDTVFLYNAGYFILCREHKGEESINIEDLQLYLSNEEAAYQCYWNPILTGQDLSEFSSATLAIEERVALPTSMHIIGAMICYTAFCFGLIGHLNRNSKTLFAAIMYIFGGLIVLVGVLQFVCVVDDELAPRMKPNAAGEPSKFSFKYGYSFFLTSLSFLPLQMCACCHAFLYFRRFPTAIDKMKIVPGLEAQLRRIELVVALDAPPIPNALQKAPICAIIYPNQPACWKSSRYNLNSPLLIPSPVKSQPPLSF